MSSVKNIAKFEVQWIWSIIYLVKKTLNLDLLIKWLQIIYINIVGF